MKFHVLLLIVNNLWLLTNMFTLKMKMCLLHLDINFFSLLLSFAIPVWFIQCCLCNPQA